MPIKFTLSIKQLEATTSGKPAKVVQKVHWLMTAKEGDETVTEHGDVVLGISAAGADFTKFEDLTEAQVKKWTEQAIGKERMGAMKVRLTARIETAKAPAVVSVTPPWVKSTKEGATK